MADATSLFEDADNNRKGAALAQSAYVELESRSAGFPYETTRDYWAQQETALYRFYRIQYMQNPLTTLLVDYLTDALAGNYDIVLGPSGQETDVETAKTFFYLNGTKQQLKEMTLQGVLLGNGFGQLVTKGGKTIQYDPNKPDQQAFVRIDAETVTIDRDDKGTETFTQNVGGSQITLKRQNLVVLRLKRYPTTPYGISFLRSSFHSLSALQELIRDVPAAVKNFAYIHRVAKLDLEGYDTVGDKMQAIDAFRQNWNRVDPANTGVVVIDKAHDVGFMANVGGQGGSQQRIMPIMDLIEPLLSFCMLNFMMALGHIQQTGANKAIIEAQEARAKEQLENLQAEWARIIDLQLMQFVVGGPLKVQIKHRQSSFEQLQDRAQLIQEFMAGIVSREFYLDRYDWIDLGQTFNPGTAVGQPTPHTDAAGAGKTDVGPGAALTQDQQVQQAHAVNGPPDKGGSKKPAGGNK